MRTSTEHLLRFKLVKQLKLQLFSKETNLD